MLLQDAVVAASREVGLDVHGKAHRLPGAGRYAAAIAGASARYVLSDRVLDLCVTMSECAPDIIPLGTAELRLPHERMWVEWTAPDAEAQGRRCRAGALVEASPDGRSGVIRFLAESADFPEPLPLPMSLRFDFDHESRSGRHVFDTAFPDGGLSGVPRALASHCDFTVDRASGALWGVDQTSGSMRPDLLARIASPTITNFVLLMYFNALLGLERPLERRESSLSRLNARRAARGRRPLLDHVEIHMRLSDGRTEPGGGRDGSRGGSRLHQVRGHLVRRNGRTFWRCSHLRGDASLGVVSGRTVHVDL